MKNTLVVLLALLGLSLAAVDADAARRFGGGTSIGKQRQITPTPRTPELYAEIAMQIEKDSAPQKIDVVALDAEVLEVVTEGVAYIASVRFSGTIREQADGAAEPFSEVWHLEKPVNGDTGWLINGIQQD